MNLSLIRSGFTATDLVVVADITIFCIAAALPLIEDAREQSRRVACANRLTEITVGSLQYQEANGQMPPLTTAEGPVDGFGSVADHQHTGALVYVLPFIGEQALFDLLPKVATQPDVLLVSGAPFSSFADMLGDPGFRAAANTQFPSVICPSDGDLLDRPIDILFYGLIQNTNEPGSLFFRFLNIGRTGPTAFGRTSYLPAVGGFYTQALLDERAIDLSVTDTAGAMRNRLTSIPTSELGDGASSTICWSESLGYESENGAFFEVGITGTNFALLSPTLITGHAWNIAADEQILFGDSIDSCNFLIGSNHVAGSNVTFCDGSVRFNSNRTSRGVMAALGCGNDGWVAERSQ